MRLALVSFLLLFQSPQSNNNGLCQTNFSFGGNWQTFKIACPNGALIFINGSLATQGTDYTIGNGKLALKHDFNQFGISRLQIVIPCQI